MNLPVAPERALRDHIAEWLENPRRTARVKLVRAQPVWTGESVLSIAGQRVHVAEGVSGLAALDAIRQAPADEFVVVLTGLGAAELGSAVWVEAERHEVATLDEWDSVPGYFGVRDRQVPPPVRALGSWVPDVLAAWRPERGYLPAPGGILSARHVVRGLLAALLGLARIDDLEVLSTALTPLDGDAVKACLRQLDSEVLDGLIRATSAEIDPSLGLALRAAGRAGAVSPVAVGLVLAELWPSAVAGNTAPSTVSAPTAAARVRIERHVGTNPSATAASRYGAAARTVTSRWLVSNSTDARNVLAQAEAICADLGWTEGAAASSFLLAGLRLRVETFAARVSDAAQDRSTLASIAVDKAFAVLKSHDASASLGDALDTAATAVRATRWLASPNTVPHSFGSAVTTFATDGAWAERALGRLWSGDTDPVLAGSYRDLAHAIQARRREDDARAAEMLSGAAFHGDEFFPIEAILAQHVVPLSSQTNVLLLVLDGMSVPTASALISELTQSGWGEIVRAGSKKRDVAVAMLPTVTEFSRTSLFAGEPMAGNQQTEKSRFAAMCRGMVFHKDDLRSEAGHALPPLVTSTISDTKQKIVAAVLNTIDDSLASADVDALEWNASSIAYLRALLNEAARSGRTVIMTSDHGHVVERGGELRNIPSSPARWRTPESGPVAQDEVLVQGPRVLSSAGQAVLAVSDGLRYASKKAGYHGGASLAELVIPISVLQPQGVASPDGWVEAPPQEPTWWNEPLRDVQEPDRVVPVAPKPRKSSKTPSVSGAVALFDTVDEPTNSDAVAQPGASLGERLTQAAEYGRRRDAGGRHPIDDIDTIAVIDALLAGGGRAHQDTLATRLGVPAHSFRGILTALRRALNVDGYEVIRVDPDRVTVILDEQLLREQFGLGR
ncbi:BREX-2 system phosphatase PglZ [Microbacterium mitrae]|uniref:BREX-2 system phosphatase PglZ n=1 Tax=Microbacterium mitrae TaxID=664640 RepID=A0A5C8HNB8_9MICO|nr:BREX-2 system phosphatase PglZ [Microbacterium mitrae]TXK03393.1 BREX-2 system phosphatase PglZ [Microbacterium mitrae]